MNLSKRMETVVSMILPQSNVIADIGCDHAYVSIALVERKLASKVIAMDVRKGPLEIAKRNIQNAGLHNVIDVRLSDGMDALQVAEADTIIIAGMGGLLITGILERGSAMFADKEKAPVLILQPQSELDKVRRYLYQHGYRICEEKMLIEDNKFYTVMRAQPVGEDDKWEEPEEADYAYGRYNLEHQNPVLFEFLKKEQILLSDISKQLLHQIEICREREKKLPDKTKNRYKEIQKQIVINEQGLMWYKEG